MSTNNAIKCLESDLSDRGDQPLDGNVISEQEYALFMRRIGISDDEPGTTVSAFNSSI